MSHNLEYKKYMRDEKVNKINDLFEMNEWGAITNGYKHMW
mgnify:FL=1